ncbi:hypothetical protein [Streptomyces sp. NPDC058045]|uniref:DUF7691 family protein n=1 Tax=Streptomyces sp. NPDC058045 TaxID=3346311 RepID=UPI0036E687C1
MSSSLTVHLLDVAATRALVGSGDDALLEAVRAASADDLAFFDEHFDYEIERGAPTAYEALRAVVHGGPFTERKEYAFQYGYAYERLCSFTGTFLNNNCFTPHRGAWLSAVDEGIRALGITAVSVESFCYGGLPDALPATHTPDCGEWSAERIAEALEQYETARRAAEETGHAPELGPEVEAAAMQCVDWMRQAVARPGHGLIGFRY